MIQSIKIGDKEHPVSFGHSALWHFEKDVYGLPIHQCDMASFGFFYAMLFCGIQAGYSKQKQPCPFGSVDDLCNALPDDITPIMSEFGKLFGATIPDSEGEDKPGAKG
jgi:hypothetical protein